MVVGPGVGVGVDARDGLAELASDACDEVREVALGTVGRVCEDGAELRRGRGAVVCAVRSDAVGAPSEEVKLASLSSDWVLLSEVVGASASCCVVVGVLVTKHRRTTSWCHRMASC